MQILMSEGTEFADHDGLGLLKGKVVGFPRKDAKGEQLRVPHVAP